MRYTAISPEMKTSMPDIIIVRDNFLIKCSFTYDPPSPPLPSADAIIILIVWCVVTSVCSYLRTTYPLIYYYDSVESGWKKWVEIIVISIIWRSRTGGPPCIYTNTYTRYDSVIRGYCGRMYVCPVWHVPSSSFHITPTYWYRASSIRVLFVNHLRPSSATKFVEINFAPRMIFCSH